MNNKFLLYFLSWILIAFSACKSKGTEESIDPSDGTMQMIIDVDWSDLEEKPSGMTILFYPSGNKVPIMRLSNNVDHYECILPEDDYSILVFNQSENEFAALKFTGLENLSTSGVFLIDDPNLENRIDRLYKLKKAMTRAKSATASMKTNLASALKKSSASRAKSVTASMKATRHTSMMSVTVEVANLVQSTRAEKSNAVVAVNGALTGLASGYLFGQQKNPDESLTLELDDWEIHYADSSNGIGYVSTQFIVFGISPLIHSGKSGLTEEDLENILYLNFLLEDGTYIPFQFNVSDRIVENKINEDLDVEIELEVHIGIQIPNITDGLDDPIVLPQTGLPYEDGGLQLNISDWGTPIKHDITLN